MTAYLLYRAKCAVPSLASEPLRVISFDGCDAFYLKHVWHDICNGPDSQDPGNIVLRILHAPNPFLTMNGAALTFREACKGCFLHPVSKAVGVLSAFI